MDPYQQKAAAAVGNVKKMLPFFIILCLTLSASLGEKRPGQVRLHPRSPGSEFLKMTTSRPKPVTEPEPNAMMVVDLGMSHVSVGVYRKNDSYREVLTNEQGSRTTPFYVAFTPDGEILLGEEAKNQQATNPENTVYDVKRLIGRSWDDPSVQNAIAKLPYKIVNVDNQPHIEVSVGTERRQYSPENITALFLAKMRDMASSYLEENVTHVLITVPGYFDDMKRHATEEAAMSVGLKLVRTYLEPTAACVGHDLEEPEETEERLILVYNLDETVVDVALLVKDSGVFEHVLSRNNAYLGTHSFDERILLHMLAQHEKKTGAVLSDIKTIARLQAEVQKATRALNTQIEHDITLPEIDFAETITRSLFEQLNEDLIESTLELTLEVLQDADLTIADVPDVVLVGSGARIPRIRELLQDLFNGTAPKVQENPEETIITGLTKMAHFTGSDGVIVLCCCYNSVSFGVEVEGGVMTKVIPRSAPEIARRSVILTTTEDNQDTAVIRIFVGERPLVAQNRFVEEFALEDIARLPKGLPQINVTFETDVNGKLTVTIREEYSEIAKEPMNLGYVLTEKDVNDTMEAYYYFDDDLHKVIQITVANFENYLLAIRDHLSRDMSPDLSEQEKSTLSQHLNDGMDWLEHSVNAEYEDIVKRQKETEELFDPFLDKLFPVPLKESTSENGHDEF